jgi:hypothetical protein
VSPLILLLIAKVAVTGALVALPLLLAPSRRLASPDPGPGGVVVYRLYGVAILALLVVYGSGLMEAMQGRFPWGVAAAGFVSNAGATAVLLFTGAWRSRPRMTLFFAAVALGLLAAAAFPEAALHRLV